MPERGPDWQKKSDGSLLFCQSHWSPTYVVNAEQLRRLQLIKARELMVSFISIAPVVIALLAWWKGYTAAMLPISLAIAYAALNQALYIYSRGRRREILSQTALSEDPLKLETPLESLAASLAGLDRLMLLFLMFPAAGFVLSFLFSLAMTVGIVDQREVAPIHPVLAVGGLMIFGPLLALMVGQARKNARRTRMQIKGE